MRNYDSKNTPKGHRHRMGRTLVAAVILIILTALVVLTFTGSLAHWVWPGWTITRRFGWVRGPLAIWADLWALLMLFRTLLWLRYKPFQRTEIDKAPSLTVVVPAYNEGPNVGISIRSIAQSVYPRGRLQVIVVDDGSVDDTWQHIQAASAQYPEMVRAIRQPVNQGKRAALAIGFKEAKSEILATIDSDSVVEPESLLSLVAPFSDPLIGAVAGKLAAQNRSKGLLTRMLHVYFLRAFDLLRAAQSGYRTVYCCPGALAAYRAELVHSIVDEWRDETFLGGPPPHGEDRALTTLVMAQGYHSVYQRNAVVHTIVPETLVRLCKMYLRWERSFVCEEIRLFSILRKRPLALRMLTLFDIVMTDIQYVLNLGTFVILCCLIPAHPVVFVRLMVTLMAAALLNLLYFFYLEYSWKGLKRALAGVLYDLMAFFCFWWILPYAVMTMREQRWGTR